MSLWLVVPLVKRAIKHLVVKFGASFVGSERGGRAAAIYYSLMESCKVNKVNPLTYMTYP